LTNLRTKTSCAKTCQIEIFALEEEVQNEQIFDLLDRRDSNLNCNILVRLIWGTPHAKTILSNLSYLYLDSNPELTATNAACRTLNFIVRSLVSLEDLSLSMNKLVDDCVPSLVKGFRGHTTLRSLNLGGNKLSSFGALKGTNEFEVMLLWFCL
jgi:hypothetical protein